MIPGDCPRKTCGNADIQQFTAVRENADYNGDQDPECTPCRAGGEGQCCGDQEDDCGEKYG